MVGGNGSREATRAVHDAIPLMQPEAGVTILSIAETDGSADRESVRPPTLLTTLRVMDFR